MSTTIGEFALDLVVDAGKGELTIGNLVASMGQLEVASVGEIAILFELAKALATITDHAIKTSLGLTDYAYSTGASTKKLQEWQHVADHANISAQAMEAALKGISINLARGAFSGDYGNLKNLGLLLSRANLTLKDFKASKPEELLEKIRASQFFQDLPEATQDMLLASAGLESVLGVLQQSRISDSDFARYIKEGGAISEKDRKEFDQIHQDFVSIYQLTTRIGNTIASWFSADTILFFNGVVKQLTDVADLIGRVGKHEAPKRELGLLQYVPGGELIHKLQMSYGAAAANFLGVPSAENPFAPISPAAPSPISTVTTQKTFNMTANVTVPGSGLNKMELADAIQIALTGTFQQVPAQSALGPL